MSLLLGHGIPQSPISFSVTWRVAQVFGSKLHHQSWVPQVLAVEDMGYHDHRLHLLSFAIRITMKKMPRFLCPLVPVSLLKSNALSYRPTPSDNLHAINPEYALLIMSRKNTARIPNGFGPFAFPVNLNTPHRGYIWLVSSLSITLVPLSLFPFVPASGAHPALRKLHSSGMKIA